MNKKYEEFRNNIQFIIKSSRLELGAIYYILKDVLVEVEHEYSRTIQHELEAEAQAKEEDENSGILD